MELTQVNNIDLSSMNTIQSNSIKSVDSIENSPVNKPLETDKIETTRVGSAFSSNLIDNISKISNLQSTQSEVQNQVNIANKIEKLTKEVIQTPKNGQVLDDIQPEIQSLMNSFNSSSKATNDIVNKIQQDNSQEKSRTYFDGILGAKPLSGQEILDAVNAQKERLSQVNEEITRDISKKIDNSKEVINLEKTTSEEQSTIKEIDFEVESSNFESKNLKNFDSSMFQTQANAQADQNIKLLAS